ncbi:MAG: NAD-dependent epimerase/dehydratase family protein [Vagococcus sp.]|jgi:UDP-glucose 4-epimerase|nr:NAD-dependent epimerase/dehydratase family protein [Vagococcus sp.]
MKRILVTGENSYIGTSFVTYMEQFKDEYEVETISVRGDEWREKDFSVYDVIFHVAGIAHRKENLKNKDLYFDINYKLTIDLAVKSKKEGIKKFVFLSSMSVYGVTEGAISRDTRPSPITSYGLSKFKAENELILMKNSKFDVSIVRPPMVYGASCKGNYQTLRKLVLKVRVFPNRVNRRSMISINNLTYFIHKIIDDDLSGYFLPQNKEIINTISLIELIAKNNNKRVFLSKKIDILIKMLGKYSKKINNLYTKSFGDLYYTKASSQLIDYESFEKSVYLTEKENENEK